MRWVETDIEYLRNNYSNLSMSIDNIAEKLGRKHSHIVDKASKLSIKRTDNCKHLNKKWLRYQYIDLNRTVEDIAKECNIQASGLYKVMERRGIETADSKFKVKDLDEKKICDLYINKEYSVEEIAEIMEVSDFTIYDRLDKNDISLRDRKSTEKSRKKMSETMKRLNKTQPERFSYKNTWTEKETEFLKKNYPNIKILKEVFEKELNRKWGAITSKAFFEGIKRPKLLVDVNGHSLYKYNLSARLRSIFCGDEWRKEVYKKDGYKCVECGSGEKLYAHHIETVSEIVERVDLSSTFNEIKEFIKKDGKLTDLKNVKSLCFDCHSDCHPHLKGLMFKQNKNKEIVNV